MRAVAFTPTPSVKHRRINARFSRLNLFILTNIRDRISIIKDKMLFFR